MASIPGAGSHARQDEFDNGHDDGDSRPPLTAGALFLVLLLFWIVTRVEYVIVLALFGLLLGTILEGPVRRLEARHIPRPAAIFMIYALILGLLVLLVFLIIPVITEQVNDFRETMPQQLQNMEDDWRGSSNPLLSGPGATMIERVQDFIDNPDGEVNVSPDTVQNVIPLVANVTAVLVGVVTTLVITFYYLMERAFIRGAVISQLAPHRRERVDRIWQDVENKVGGWMRGQLVLMLIIGVLATVSYGILDLRFWPLLGLWAGLTEIIPIVGPWIGGIPAVLVALTQGWQTAAITALIILAMQGLENWVLVPRVMRGAVGLSPLTVLIAILTGTTFMGVVGALLAIPIAAGVQVILSYHFSGQRWRRASQQQPSGWRWMLNRASGRDDDEPVVVAERFHDDGGHGQTLSEDFVLHQPDTDAPPVGPPVPTEAAPAPAPAPARRQRQWAPFGSGSRPDPAPSAQDDESPPTRTDGR